MSDKIIVSGFEPYGKYAENISMSVAQRLHKITLHKYAVRSTIFRAAIPTYDRGATLLRKAEGIGAKGIISLGSMMNGSGLSIERYGQNLVYDPKRCNKGTVIPIDRRRPFGERLYINMRPWQLTDFSFLCKNAHIRFSGILEDPGVFRCNHLIYQVLRSKSNHNKTSIPFLFIHVPQTMDIDEVILGLEILLKESSI